MFTHHPILGVGLDRYGAYFRQYRDATQSLRRGSDAVSNNAHNVPLQLAATGGILVLVAFLLLTFFIAWRGVVALRIYEGSEQIVVAGIFAAWIAYQAQSLISIDNLAIAIWGYILGGIIVGISLRPEQAQVAHLKNSNIQQFISLILVLFPFIATTLFIKGEAAMHLDTATQPPASQAEVPAYEKFLMKPLSFNFKEPQFQLNIAVKEARVADFNPAISLLKDVIANDPRNYNATATLAQIYEYQKDWASAIRLRKNIAVIDEFDQGNLLQLGLDQKASGNIEEAKKVIALINAFAPDSTEAKRAATELGK
jgi:tetratricopeptide (TPR) repeat protein